MNKHYKIKETSKIKANTILTKHGLKNLVQKYTGHGLRAQCIETFFFHKLVLRWFYFQDFVILIFIFCISDLEMHFLIYCV